MSAQTSAPIHARLNRAIPFPGLQGRLVLAQAAEASWGLEDELACGTWSEPACELIDELERAGLRGRGGASFPAHVKWRAVKDGTGPRTVVANGEEGEPASVKDQWLLVHRPHLVLHGLSLAAQSVNAQSAVVYLSHQDTIAPVRRAIEEARIRGLWPSDVNISIHVVEPTYVAGEETSVVRSINGGPALPVAKPPRPFEKGVDDGPTLVTNVETLAHVSWIAAHGAEAFNAVGTSTAKGTALFTVNAADRESLVVEAPFGVTLMKLAQLIDVTEADIRGVLVGGWFGGLATTRDLRAACCPEDLASKGLALGCGSVTFITSNQDPLAYAAEIARWYEAESAQQCGVCIKGTASIAQAVQQLQQATDAEPILADLTRWGTGLRKRGACALLDGAANLARTTAEFVQSKNESPSPDDTPNERHEQ